MYICGKLLIKYRSTPVECLHTLLLGPFKYMTEYLMNRLTPSQKREVQSKIRGFDFSPFPCSLSPGMCNHCSWTVTNFHTHCHQVCNHHRSFHGRDFKILAQVCLFIFWNHLLPTEKPVWLSLCKVHMKTKMNECSITYVVFAGIPNGLLWVSWLRGSWRYVSGTT